MKAVVAFAAFSLLTGFSMPVAHAAFMPLQGPVANPIQTISVVSLQIQMDGGVEETEVINNGATTRVLTFGVGSSNF